VTPDAINIMSARDGGEIARLPLGEAANFRAGAPYWVVHRADLQAALKAEVNHSPDIELRLAASFEDVATHVKGLTVVQRWRQRAATGVGCGPDRRRRHLVLGPASFVSPRCSPQFSGLIAWRGTLDATALPREYTSPRVQLWMGPKAHLVAYPISGARRINVVAIVRAPGTGRAGARRARPTKSKRPFPRAGLRPRGC